MLTSMMILIHGKKKVLAVLHFVILILILNVIHP